MKLHILYLKKIAFYLFLFSFTRMSGCSDPVQRNDNNNNHEATLNNSEAGLFALSETALKQKKETALILYGMDVSKYNGNVISEINPQDSLSFIICKATEGASITDRDFFANWEILKQKQLVRGAYHFYHYNDDPLVQATHYLKTAGTPGITEMSPIVDVEPASLPGNIRIDKIRLQADLIKFMNYVEKACHRKPIIYTNRSFADQYLDALVFSEYRLWIADYTKRGKPTLPDLWQQKGFMVWQKSDQYSINSQKVDFDIYFGNKEGLLQ